MWEVRAADGQLEQLLAWLLPRLAGQAQVYRSAAGEPRVVVLDPTGEVSDRLAGVPAELIARPAHAWQFEPVSSSKPVSSAQPVSSSKPVDSNSGWSATAEPGERI